jgi:hypothetical protein
MRPVADHGDSLRRNSQFVNEVLRESRMNHNDAIGSPQDESFDRRCDGCRDAASLPGFGQSECINVLHPNDYAWARWSQPDA